MESLFQASKAGKNNFGKSPSAVPTIMLGQVDITRRYASVDRRRFSAIDRMLPIIITGDCTHKSPLGSRKTTKKKNLGHGLKKMKISKLQQPFNAQEDTGVPFHRNFNSILTREHQKNFL